MTCKPITATEADRILSEANRMELNMTDAEKLVVVNEITGEDYTVIDHSDKAEAAEEML